MRMSEGVEWATHCCMYLGWVADKPLAVARLAAYHELPSAYLNKQLQALKRAGILTSTSGPQGGFQLARTPERITLMDIVAAIEGREEAFRCAEIRQRGPHAGPMRSYDQQCVIKETMSAAELAWRRELAECDLGEVMARALRRVPGLDGRVRDWFG